MKRLTDLELRFEEQQAIISATTNAGQRQDILGLVFLDQNQIPSLEDVIPGTSPTALENISLKLTPQMATLLNQSFAVSTFSANTVFGALAMKFDLL